MGPDNSPANDEPRILPAARAFAWYGQALRWLKQSPFMLVLAALTFACEYLLQQVPDAGMLLSKVITPIVGCSLVAAADRVASGGRAQWSDLLVALRLSAATLAAVVFTEFFEYLAEAAVAFGMAGTNLITTSGDDGSLNAGTVLTMFVVGMLVSLPFTLVPFFAVLDNAGFAGSIRPSLRAFSANLPALLLYGAIAYGLLIVGLVLLGLGVILVLPLWTLAAYAALRDIYPRSVAVVPPD